MLKSIVSRLHKNPFIVKEILCCYLHAPTFYGSFKYDILDYFEKTSKDSKQLTLQKFSNPKSLEIKGNGTPEDKLVSIYNDFDKISKLNDEELTKELIEDLDIKCFSIICFLKPAEILKLFHEFYKILKHKFQFLYFYDKSIPLLVEAVENNLLTSNEVVQVLFFISLSGERSANLISNLQPYLPDLNDLPLIEKCIVADVFCKSSIKLQVRQARIIEKVLEKNFKTLIENPNLLEAVCEAIISREPSEELSLKILSKAVLNFNEPMSFNNNAHVLHLYARALIFEPRVIDKIVKECISMINDDLKECKNSLSIKDVDMFLWSISNLGITVTLSEKLILRKFIETRFKEYRRKENLNYLVNSMLFLNMLRCWSMKVKYFFSNLFFNLI